ncbi:ATP-binding protein [Luteitalea sp. TBR-22]|uniref:hypothetical protein n=1 Tax=Luteitalea sp. TBR-22 TaxID=2802971 RepID=UPI001AF149F0|nr:hypothetical protein [Luteitalea sp. TBR-22]BCS32686.1 ATP-binding protein [Luteitalea sp. TBR-22]
MTEANQGTPHQMVGLQRASDGSDGRDGPDQLARLMELADTSGMMLFHSTRKQSYAMVPVGEGSRVLAVTSDEVGDWLGQRFYATYGVPPSAHALDVAVRALSGKARFGGEERDLFLRLGSRENSHVVEVDLGDEVGRAVQITASGWTVVPSATLMFRRPSAMAALPTPAPGGSLELLRPFVNASHDHFQRLVGFLVACCRPSGPYPILEITGPQGASKTTLARVIRALIDPSLATARSAPSNDRDLAIAAHNAYLLSFDNMSQISPQMSDALCRISTGGGWSGRALYHDAKEMVLEYSRPMVLNGIISLARRPDLLERTIPIELQPIKVRRSEDELWRDFGAVRPLILGALYDAVACSLSRRHLPEPTGLPRLADSAVWVHNAEPSLGWPPGTFINLMTEVRRNAARRALHEYDGLLAALICLVDSAHSAGGKEWKGTMSDLLTYLVKTEVGGLPNAPSGLGDLMRRLVPALAEEGIDVTFDRNRNTRFVLIGYRQLATEGVD